MATLPTEKYGIHNFMAMPTVPNVMSFYSEIKPPHDDCKETEGVIACFGEWGQQKCGDVRNAAEWR